MGSGSDDMKKCFGRLTVILWMPAVMGMMVCDAQTMAYAADMTVNVAGVTACMSDTAVHASAMAVYASDMIVYAINTDDIKKNTVFQVSTDVELHEMPDITSAVTAALPGGTPVIVKEDAADGWCKVAYREQTGYVQISFLDIVGSPVLSVAANEQAMMPENGTMQKDQVQSDKTPTNAPQSGGPAQNDRVMQDTGAQSDNITASDSETQPDNDLTAARGADTLDEEFRIIQEQNQLSYQEAQTAKEQAESDRMWGLVIAVLVAAIFAVGIVTTLKGNRKNQGTDSAVRNARRSRQTRARGKRSRQ